MQKRKWWIGLAVFLALLWAGMLALAKWVEHGLNANQPAVDAQPAGLSVYWDAPAFSFLDQDQKPVTNDSLRGHVWIADFFFSQCTAACPLLTSKFLLLQKQIASPEIRFISFSVDPEHDSPAVLKKYAQLWQGDESRWRLLSTDPTGLTNVTRGMKVTVAPSGDKDNPILHSTMFLLVDAKGQVRGIYDSNDSDAIAQLISDAESLDGNNKKLSTDLASTTGDAALRGRLLFGSMGCMACHSQPRIAPPLQSLYGSMVRLDDHRTVWADEAYLHESIVDPNAKVVAGYGRNMPNYRSYLSDGQIMDLVAYLKSISSNPTSGHGIVAGPTTASTAGTDELLIDPVCKMQVTGDLAGPHADYQGKRYFFCSDHCRQQFLRNPAQYTLTPNMIR